GHGNLFVQEWDGAKWVKVSGDLSPMNDVVEPLLASAASEYVGKNSGWPKRTEAATTLAQDARPTDAKNAAASTGAAAPILAVNNIEVIYDHVILVLKGVSLTVPKGGIVALLGANGAG